MGEAGKGQSQSRSALGEGVRPKKPHQIRTALCHSLDIFLVVAYNQFLKKNPLLSPRTAGNAQVPAPQFLVRTELRTTVRQLIDLQAARSLISIKIQVRGPGSPLLTQLLLASAHRGLAEPGHVPFLGRE